MYILVTIRVIPASHFIYPWPPWKWELLYLFEGKQNCLGLMGSLMLVGDCRRGFVLDLILGLFLRWYPLMAYMIISGESYGTYTKVEIETEIGSL